MPSLPSVKRIRNTAALQQFGQAYLTASGLSVPNEYLSASQNRVYAIYNRSAMIGGFILGKGNRLRTLEVFAQPAARQQLYEEIGTVSDFTEITCFWIAAPFRRSTLLNTFIWLSLAFRLRFFGCPKILFGTCSNSLARLYGITPKSELIHRDRINEKRTYIFQSARSVCLKGFLEIIRFKLKRTARIRKGRRLRSI